MWYWDDKGDADNEVECNDGFAGDGDGQDANDDSPNPFA